MTNRQEQIKERAYQLWLDEGQIEGRDEDYWFRAEAAIGQEEITDDTIPLGAEAPQSGTEQQSVPPARMGMAQRNESPVEAGDQSNPVHHEGRLPPLTT